MANVELEKYITEARARGLSDAAIQQELLKAGWSALDLQAVFSSTVPTLTIPPQPVFAIKQTPPTSRRGLVITTIVLVMMVVSAGASAYFFFPEAIGLKSSSVVNGDLQPVSQSEQLPQNDLPATEPITSVVSKRQECGSIARSHLTSPSQLTTGEKTAMTCINDAFIKCTQATVSFTGTEGSSYEILQKKQEGCVIQQKTSSAATVKSCEIPFSFTSTVLQAAQAKGQDTNLLFVTVVPTVITLGGGSAKDNRTGNIVSFKCDPDAKDASGLSPQTVDSSGWQTYENPDLGYRIKYPPPTQPPYEVLDYGDPQAVYFYYNSGKTANKLEVGRYTPESCKTLYDGIKGATLKTEKVGTMSYYTDASDGVSSYGTFLLQSVLISIPNSYSDGSCASFSLTAANSDGSQITNSEKQASIDLLYTIVATLTRIK